MKNSLLKKVAILATSLTIFGCSALSPLSLKIDYVNFPVTMKIEDRNRNGKYDTFTVWPDKLNYFFDRNKTRSLEVSDLVESYKYIIGGNLYRDITESKKDSVEEKSKDNFNIDYKIE